MDEAEAAALEALLREPGGLERKNLARELAAHYPSTDPAAVLAGIARLVSEASGRMTLREDTAHDVGRALESFTTGRPIEWVDRRLSQGEILAAFGVHCLDELDDVEVREAGPARLELGWRKEVSGIDLRAGLLFCERLAGPGPRMLVTDLETVPPALVSKFVNDGDLRSKIALCDLARLEKINAVKSSAFVYFEWFLRDTYGVKLAPAAAFTQGLIDRGIIHLGMG